MFSQFINTFFCVYDIILNGLLRGGGKFMRASGIQRETFKFNFLKQIILRLDFQGVLQTEMENVLLQVKPFLKEKKFNRYEQKVNNEIDINFNSGIFQSENPIKEVRNIVIHSFVNEDKGYTIDLSTNYVCLKVNTVKYVSFEEYSDTFLGIVNIYKSMIDFFTVKRLGLRKINFCFFKDINNINKYFEKRYFDCFDLFEGTNLFVSEKKANFGYKECKVNLLTYIEQGQLGSEKVYKTTLDSDIYVDDSKAIEKRVFDKNGMSDLNDTLFSIYVDTLTDEFVTLLSDEETEWSNEIMGVDKNE